MRQRADMRMIRENKDRNKWGGEGVYIIAYLSFSVPSHATSNLCQD